MKKIRLRSSSPVSNYKQSQPLLKSVPSANENQAPKHSNNNKKDEQVRFVCFSRHNLDLPRERSPQITKMKYNLTLETPIIFKLLNGVSKQSTLWNVEVRQPAS